MRGGISVNRLSSSSGAGERIFHFTLINLTTSWRVSQCYISLEKRWCALDSPKNTAYNNVSVKELHLRGHHVLCLAHFRGMGYSESFVRNAEEIVENLRKNMKVVLTKSADDVCKECPHLTEKGCGKPGFGELKAEEMDESVLSGIGVDPGSRKRAQKIYKSTCQNQNILTSFIESFCSDCEWWELCNPHPPCWPI